jgi:hypothetical protein
MFIIAVLIFVCVSFCLYLSSSRERRIVKYAFIPSPPVDPAKIDPSVTQVSPETLGLWVAHRKAIEARSKTPLVVGTKPKRPIKYGKNQDWQKIGHTLVFRDSDVAKSIEFVS